MKRYFLLLLGIGTFFHSNLTISYSGTKRETPLDRHRARQRQGGPSASEITERIASTCFQNVQAEYGLPDEALVSMGGMKSITVTPTTRAQTISTWGLGGCMALALYARQDKTQKTYMSHHSTCPLLLTSARKIIEALKEENFNPDIIKIILIPNGEYVENKDTKKYEIGINPETKNMGEDILQQFQQSFLQSRVNLLYSPYALSSTIQPLAEGNRDIIVSVDPDYEQSYFYNVKEDQRINLND